MNTVMAAVSVASVMACALIVALCVIAFAHMSKTTRHCYRFIYLVIGVASMALALSPLYEHEGWNESAQNVFIVAVALYMLLDRRRIRPVA